MEAPRNTAVICEKFGRVGFEAFDKLRNGFFANELSNFPQ